MKLRRSIGKINCERRMKLKPRIVASLGKNVVKDVLQASEADMIEVRLDLIERNPLQALRSIRGSTNQPLIATNRLRAEGGRFGGNEKERMDLLFQATENADFVDIELRAEQRDELIERIDKPLIVSFHDFIGMPAPEELRSIVHEISGTRASIAKIAVTPSCLQDNLTLLELLLETDMPLSVIALGKLGRHMRAVAPIYGSALTYGYVSEPTALGQMSVSELRQLQMLL